MGRPEQLSDSLPALRTHAARYARAQDAVSTAHATLFTGGSGTSEPASSETAAERLKRPTKKMEKPLGGLGQQGLADEE